MGDVVEAVLQKLFPWMLDPMGKALQGMMVGAFSSTAGSVSYAEWNVAITAANRIGWVMGFVNMLICAVGAVHAAVKASPAESVKSFAMAVLAWPLTAICVSVMITCEGIVSLLSARILAVGADTTKGRGMESMVSAMFKKILEQASVLHSLTMLLVYLVLFVGVFLLCCMLAARTLCLVLLAAVAPLPVMSAGWKATRPAMRRWLSAVVGVMLAKPLAALVITVGSALMTSQTTSGVGEGSFWDLLVGIAAIYMACYSPKMIMPVVQFLGDDRSMGMQQAASQAGWNALPGPVEYGGQGLPTLLNTACIEMWNAASMACRSSGRTSTSRAFEPSEGPTTPCDSSRSMMRPAFAKPMRSLRCSIEVEPNCVVITISAACSRSSRSSPISSSICFFAADTITSSR